MGRMHSKGKGMSGSALPYKRTPPSWLKVTSPEVWPACTFSASTSNSRLGTQYSALCAWLAISGIGFMAYMLY